MQNHEKNAPTFIPSAKHFEEMFTEFNALCRELNDFIKKEYGNSESDAKEVMGEKKDNSGSLAQAKYLSDLANRMSKTLWALQLVLAAS